MNSSNLDWEENVRHAVIEAISSPTHQCIPEETLSNFADIGGKHPQAKEIIEHLTTCLFCYQGYVSNVEIQHLASSPEISIITELPEKNKSTHVTNSSNWLSFFRTRRSLISGGFCFATGIIFTFLILSLIHSPFLVSKKSERDVALDLREKAVRTRERLSNSKIAAANQLTKKNEVDRLKLQDLKNIRKENQKLAAINGDSSKKLKNPNVKFQLPRSPSNLASIPKTIKPKLNRNNNYILKYLPLKDAGIEISNMAGGTDSVDPLPFALLSPLPGSTLMHDKILFSWDRTDFTNKTNNNNLASYIVQFARIDRPDELKASPLLKTNYWNPKPGEGPLPGHIYFWNVLAFNGVDSKDHEPIQSPQGHIKFMFRTLSNVELKSLKSIKNNSIEKGIFFTKFGMWDQAQHEFEKILQKSPENIQAKEALNKTLQLEKGYYEGLLQRIGTLPRAVDMSESDGIKQLILRIKLNNKDKK